MDTDDCVYTYEYTELDQFVREIDYKNIMACNFITINKGYTYSVDTFITNTTPIKFIIKVRLINIIEE